MGNFFRKKSVTIFSLVAGFVVLVATAILIFKTSNHFRVESSWKEHSKDIVVLIQQLKFHFANAESAERGFAITHRENFLDTYDDSKSSIRKVFDLIQLETQDNPAQQAYLKELKPMIDAEIIFLEDIIHLIKNGNAESAVKKVQSGEGKKIMDQVRTQINKIENHELTLLKTRTAKANEISKYLNITMYTGLFLILALMFLACTNMYYDIRRRIQIQKDLLVLKEKAVEASKMKSDFLANMSHEIRTPMNGIHGMIELLLRTKLTEEQTEFVNTLHESSNSLLALINDILDLSKIESGKLELDIVPFDLAELMKSVHKVMEYSAKHKNLKLAVSYDDQIPQMMLGDSLRLRQIILNLVGNAIKFSSKGTVRINARLKETIESKAIVRFEVIDEGVGFDEATKQKLFAAFSQADSSTTRKYGGTGLGLSICRLLVEMMGGKIDVDSRPGMGSTFWFEIPLDASVCRIETAESNQGKIFDKENPPYILVAEDNIINQKVISNLLGKMNCRFKLVNNGEEVLNALTIETFDMILMDCHMPVLDGYETARQIRKSPSSQNTIPIIAATASVVKGEREKCLASGMNDYISKPVSFDKLLLKIGEWSGRHSLKMKPTLIDPVAIQKITDLNDDDSDLLKEIVEIFINTFPDDLGKMHSFLNDKNFEGLSDVAHRLKSTCKHLGITDMVEICAMIEESASVSSEITLKQKLDELEKLYTNSILEFKKLKIVS